MMMYLIHYIELCESGLQVRDFLFMKR